MKATSRACEWCWHPLPPLGKKNRHRKYHLLCVRDKAFSDAKYKRHWNQVIAFYRRVLRDLCIYRQQGRCPHCGNDLDPLDKEHPIHLDRIRPAKFGGLYTPWNVVATDPGCNLRRGAPDDWPAVLCEFTEFYGFERIEQHASEAYLPPPRALFTTWTPLRKKRKLGGQPKPAAETARHAERIR